MADVGLDASERHASLLGTGGPQHLSQRLRLADVTDARRCSMRLDETDGRRIGSSPRPGTLDSELLPDWVRRCDAFAFTVRRTADPKNHRINAVAVALGVGQSFE